jgi:hypothetical protein
MSAGVGQQHGFAEDVSWCPRRSLLVDALRLMYQPYVSLYDG